MNLVFPKQYLRQRYGAIALFFLGLVTGLSSAFAEPSVRVITDIAPIQSLVWRVMDGVGKPAVLIRPGTSPHHYSLRPSDAKVLQDAEVIFFVGSGLTPWLEPRLPVLAPDARRIELSSVAGIVTLKYRSKALFEEERSPEAHDSEHTEGHGSDGSEDNEHNHAHPTDGIDPHLWLDPQNARIWITAIAEVLSKVDPKNADRYRQNAVSAAFELSALTDQIRSDLEGLKTQGFIVFHDAYQYWERRFGFTARGALLSADASTPSPKRLMQLRQLVDRGDATCVLSEPQFDPGLIHSVFAAGSVKVGLLDPEGVRRTPGPHLYRELLKDIADEVKRCLSP